MHKRSARLRPQSPAGRRRRGERGGVAVETALSLIIVVGVLMAGLQLGHAMVIRQVIGNATNRAARVCSVRDPAQAGACVPLVINTAMGNYANNCNPLQIDNNIVDQIAGVDVVRAGVACTYQGQFGGLLRRWGADEQIVLRSQSAMPFQTN